MQRAGLVARRGFFWGRKKTANVAAPLIDKNEEMMIMRYRGKIEDFNTRANVFESFLKEEQAVE